MARPAKITRENLAPLIRARGPVSASELAALLRVNRTTIARTLPDFGDELVTLGATRSTRYLLRREIGNIGSRWPIYRLDEDGRASQWAELEALHGQVWRVSWTGTPPEWAGFFMTESGLWSGLPFFLSDARPQGFLGRIIASQISRTSLMPEDARSWSEDEVLVYQQMAGEDFPGNLVVGDGCLRRALARSANLPGGNAISEEDRDSVYPILAREIAGSLPNSSVGGEQPKFLTTLRDGAGEFQAVLVKFSAPMDQASGRRWADLLLCEFHARKILADLGLANPGVSLLDADGRRFLEIPRFDRIGPGGRRGMVSLEALSSSILGSRSRNWIEATTDLHRRGLIDSTSLASVERLHAFGELIGNTDMHGRNLAFLLDDTVPLRLAPAYDMLPMLWTPGSRGELIDHQFAPAPPLPAMVEPWREAAGWADLFWDRVAEDGWLSPDFARIVDRARAVLAQLRRHMG